MNVVVGFLTICWINTLLLLWSTRWNTFTKHQRIIWSGNHHKQTSPLFALQFNWYTMRSWFYFIESLSKLLYQKYFWNGWERWNRKKNIWYIEWQIDIGNKTIWKPVEDVLSLGLYLLGNIHLPLTISIRFKTIKWY